MNTIICFSVIVNHDFDGRKGGGGRNSEGAGDAWKGAAYLRWVFKVRFGDKCKGIHRERGGGVDDPQPGGQKCKNGGKHL